MSKFCPRKSEGGKKEITALLSALLEGSSEGQRVVKYSRTAADYFINFLRNFYVRSF